MNCAPSPQPIMPAIESSHTASAQGRPRCCIYRVATPGCDEDPAVRRRAVTAAQCEYKKFLKNSQISQMSDPEALHLMPRRTSKIRSNRWPPTHRPFGRETADRSDYLPSEPDPCGGPLTTLRGLCCYARRRSVVGAQQQISKWASVQRREQTFAPPGYGFPVRPEPDFHVEGWPY
jgi:hypothetical protein